MEPDDTIDYYDAWATVYDAESAPTEDVSYYVDRATDVDGRVLEVGCGTGRIYLELLREGVDADGIDLSTGMLDQLRANAAEEGLDPDVWHADMRAFSVDDPYELVIVPFRAFLHTLTIDDQLAALRSLLDATADDGELVLNFYAPDCEFVVENYGTEEVESVEIDGQQYRVLHRADFEDDVEGIVKGEKVLFDENDDVVVAESYRLKSVTKREFELLLRLVGASSWEVTNFDGDPPQSAEDELVWTVRP
ncbi:MULTISPECIES: class I SAM-dependent methyltransferase [Haloferax]|uniref:Methyltransferase domain-containing protein n=1 Tax=Haloferax marinum TaxID=2666143 RepID=A0A6A8GAJ7_9EURY|nr:MULTISPECIES: class I SAM-dependent methyltransferase [Haloferax]KAB1198633.1 class I SAM-dependent methyltransferase [Haloferax sp. CBA1150]MRW97745.1 methyltransferase domain-containing protein [Haloferax marinum]